MKSLLRGCSRGCLNAPCRGNGWRSPKAWLAGAIASGLASGGSGKPASTLDHNVCLYEGVLPKTRWQPGKCIFPSCQLHLSLQDAMSF